MSFGRPGTFDNFKVSPPARGSFPLDHDGECKDAMISYIKCLRVNSADNGKCRLESKRYLQCRMDKGLMTKDDMTNLGLGDVEDRDRAASPISAIPGEESKGSPAPLSTTPSTSTSTPSTQHRI